MSTIYSGFHRKLKDRKLSWEDRLKIARYAWTTPTAFIPNKNQVLLDWLFGALLNKKKLKLVDSDATLIWRTINDFVRSNFVRRLSSTSKFLVLRASATQVITEALLRASLSTEEARLTSWMLGACHAVLTLSPISYLLTSRTKSLNVVFSSSLKLLREAIEFDEERRRVKPEIEAFALSSVEAFGKAAPKRSDQRQTLQFFIDDAFDTVLFLVSGKRLEEHCAGGSELREKLLTTTQNILFHRDHKSHLEQFIDSDGVKIKRPPLVQALFEKLRRNLAADPVNSTTIVMQGIQLAKLDQKRKFRFAMLILERKEATPVANWHIKALRTAFEDISSEKLFDLFDFSQIQYISEVVDSTLTFLRGPELCEEAFPLLTNLLRCNPQCLDKEMTTVLRRVWVELDVGDMQSERDDFMGFLFALYGKLRRLDKLFIHVQQAITSADRVAADIRCSNVFGAFENSGQKLPLGTVLTIWENLHDCLTTSKSDYETGAFDEAKLRLLCLVEMAFLQKLPLSLHSIPENLSANVQSCVDVMGELGSGLKSLSKATPSLKSCADAYLDTLSRLYAYLSYYLPERHKHRNMEPIGFNQLCDFEFFSVGLNDAVTSLPGTIVDWVTYHGAPLGRPALEKLVEGALDRFLNDGVEGWRQFLVRDDNMEVPGFFFVLVLRLTEKVENREISSSVLVKVVQLLEDMPIFLLDEATVSNISFSLLSRISEEGNFGDDDAKIADFLLTLMTDRPQCLDSRLVENRQSMTLESILESLRKNLTCLSCSALMRTHGLDLVIKLINSGFRLGLFERILPFLETLIDGLVLCQNEFNLSLVLSCIVCVLRRFQKLRAKALPTADQEREQLLLNTFLTKGRRALTEVAVDDSALLSNSMRLRALTMVAEASFEVDENVKKIVTKAATYSADPSCLPRSVWSNCLRTILKKSHFAKLFVESANGFETVLSMILDDPYRRKSPELSASTIAKVEDPVELPTATFDVLDRFFGGDSSEQKMEEDDDRVSEDNKSVSAGECPEVNQQNFSMEIATSTSVLFCVDYLSRIEPEPDTVLEKILSNLDWRNLDDRPEAVLVSLEFCRQVFLGKKQQYNSSKLMSAFSTSVRDCSFAFSLKADCLDDDDTRVIFAILGSLSAFCHTVKKTLESSSVNLVEVVSDILCNIPSPSNHAADFFLSIAEIVNLLLAKRSFQILKMAPTFYVIIDRLLQLLTQMNDLDVSPSNPRLVRCANSLSRLFALLRPHKKDLSKLAPYWISHFVRALAMTEFHDSKVRREVAVCVFCLMDLCDDLAFDLLRTHMPANDKEVLHRLKQEYEQDFKFMGKI